MPFISGPSIPNEAAGTTVADPILKDIGLDLILAASSLDVFSVNSAAIDQASGAIGTNIRGNLSPAYTTTTNGTAGTYNDTTKQLAISSTAGLGVGDYLEVSHAAVNGGVPVPVKIASVVNATAVTLVGNPFDGSNKTAISYQVAWRFAILAGSNGSVSSGAGQINYAKLVTADSAGNANLAPVESPFYVRDAPAGSAFISVNAQDGVAGASGNTLTPALAVLAGWASRGGVVSLAWANHSTLLRNDFRWSDGSTAEKAYAAATGANLTLTAGDGLKAGRLVMRGLLGGGVTVERDVTYLLDNTAPTIVMYIAGR
jgi:hypothetical protein